MRILFDIAHPASVHFFKNPIRLLIKNGNQVFVLARNKDITFKLLESYEIPYVVLGKHFKTLIGKFMGAFSHVYQMLVFCLRNKIDILIDAGTIYPSIVSFLLGKPNIIFNNTDVDFTLDFTRFFNSFYVTNLSFKKKLGKRQVFINSFNELSFLHPETFQPNPEILEIIGLSKTDTLILMRFVQWKAVDDIGFKGHNIMEIRNLVKLFSKYGKILISCEYELPDDLQRYQIEKMNLPFGTIQDIEFYTTLFYGESGAMASECAMLGIPSIFISKKKLGFIEELEKKYALVYKIELKEEAKSKAISLLESENSKILWKIKRNKMLSEKINYSKFIVWYIEHFPNSYEEMKDME